MSYFHLYISEYILYSMLLNTYIDGIVSHTWAETETMPKWCSNHKSSPIRRNFVSTGTHITSSNHDRLHTYTPHNLVLHTGDCDQALTINHKADVLMVQTLVSVVSVEMSLTFICFCWDPHHLE